jgi:DNA-damage-inducible protein D
MSDHLREMLPMTFEDFKQQNGQAYWFASDLQTMLGYSDYKSFKKAIDRAIKACIALNIDHFQNFRHTTRTIDGIESEDCKLSRFACYLTVMNGDPKKAEVASAQVYFVEQTRRFELSVKSSDDFERLIIRDELTDSNKSLCSVAKAAGVSDYAKFTNAGYLGMYNMPNWKLANQRGIESKNLLNHMGRAELAANLFRTTMTEERIKNFKIKGQQALESTHYEVGKKVRDFVSEETGKKPEQLPVERPLPDVKKGIKAGYRKMLKADK